MKVYIVMFSEWDDYELKGVYLDKEKAENAAIRHNWETLKEEIEFHAWSENEFKTFCEEHGHEYVKDRHGRPDYKECHHVIEFEVIE